MSVSESPITIGQEADAERYTATTGIQGAGARGRAKTSVTPLPSSSHEAVTESVTGTDIQQRAQGFADSLAAKWQARLGDSPPLAHARPPSLAQARDRLHADVAHCEFALTKALRGAYGYLHLLLKLVMHAVEWVTYSPWGLLVTAFVVFVFIHW